MKLKELLSNVAEWSAQPDEPGHEGCTDLAWDCAAELSSRLKVAVVALEKIKHPLQSFPSDGITENEQSLATEALKEIDEPSKQ